MTKSLDTLAPVAIWIEKDAADADGHQVDPGIGEDEAAGGDGRGRVFSRAAVSRLT